MSTSEEKSEFLSKRSEFRTLIRSLALSQVASKANFRQAKAETHPIHRSEILNPIRTDMARASNGIRCLLLAYAMFRGQPYKKVEQKTSEPIRAYNIWVAFRRLGLEAKYDKTGIEMWLAGKIPDFQIDIHTDGSVTTKFRERLPGGVA